MNSKNHCNELPKKRQFCYLDIAKRAKNDCFLPVFSKVRVSKNSQFLKKYHENG
jgi:hypothetical protein